MSLFPLGLINGKENSNEIRCIDGLAPVRFTRSEPLRVVFSISNAMGPEFMPVKIVIAMLIAYCLSSKSVSGYERVNHTETSL